MIPKLSFLTINRSYRQQGPAIMWQLQQQHGDIFYAHPPLLPRQYFILDADEVYNLLVKQRPMLEKPGLINRFLQSSFGDGLFTSGGDLWRQQRRLMQPAFHHAQVGRYAGQIVRHTEAMLTTWQDGEVVSIDEAMHDTVGEFMSTN
jgi:cytochrome P450